LLKQLRSMTDDVGISKLKLGRQARCVRLNEGGEGNVLTRPFV